MARKLCIALSSILTAATALAQAPDFAVDLAKATIVTPEGDRPLVESTAATVLVEEIERRTGITFPISTAWPAEGPAIVITSGSISEVAGHTFPGTAPDKAEAFTIATQDGSIWIVGADPKGALNGVGKLLRTIYWKENIVGLTSPLNTSEAPDHAIRGHQLGYRTTANSYDAWSPAQYDQYVRELALFGVNAIENIPFQDDDSPHMQVTREEMNRALGESCEKYGVQYWVWTPATEDLTDPEKRAAMLKQHEEYYKASSHLDAIFFPGGDPGNNHPKDVMPFLEDVAKLLEQYHPGAKIWMSPQGFEDEAIDYYFNWIAEHKPTWFGGAVGGPSSLPLPDMRKRLPEQYKLRDYPDITHTVRSQYATVWIDPAFAYTSGREGTNPEPVYYSTIFRAFDEFTDGFITYSDGMHDDVNKTIWSALGWDHEADVRDVIIEYCRLNFGPDVAEAAADGIFALERNWSGALARNGAVETTLSHWRNLADQNPQLANNWRWQLCLLKANYDAYVRARLIHEQKLEQEANAVLATASEIGADKAMEEAAAVFARTQTFNPRPELRAEVFDLCDRLFNSIGYQSSVEKYGANNAQRSAVLDFVDFPLNNVWWYEDQFAEIKQLPTEQEKLDRLKVLYTWENPGPGSYYDDIGNVAKSDRVLRGEALTTDPLMRRNPNPDFMWWDDGRPRVRQSWVSKMDWPIGLRYDGVDPNATYVVRTTGLSQCLLRVNGQRVEPTIDGKEVGEIKEFPIPADLYKDGSIVLTFDVPHEPGINWRQASRLSEVWLIKK